jgi:hypothetical protein
MWFAKQKQAESGTLNKISQVPNSINAQCAQAARVC